MTNRRVVITGLGIVSCLGNDAESVSSALRLGKSGISFNPTYAEMGLRSRVSGSVDIDLSAHVDRKNLRFMGDAAAFAYVAAQQAIAQSGLETAEVSNPRTGLIVGSGGGSTRNQVAAIDTARERGVRKIGPYRVTQTMGSTASACLATPLGIKGLSFSISSACTTSLHCVGVAYEQIKYGVQDVVFAGGGEEEDWTMSAMFDAMGALSSAYNEQPERASRPYDVDRDGFVIAGGGGVLVLEEYEHARARGATILAEIAGYAATSDGHDMVLPSGEGAERCMRAALGELPGASISYINTHGTSTPGGDKVEVAAMQRVFGEQLPCYGSTKSLSGHSLGAAGVQELIYCLLMLQGNFIAGSINVENADPEINTASLVRTTREKQTIDYCLSNSFGFGGTNGCMVIKRAG